MLPSIVHKPFKTTFKKDNYRNMNSLNPHTSFDHGYSSYILPELQRETTNSPQSINLHNNKASVPLMQSETRNTMKQTTVELIDNTRNYKPFVINGETNNGLTNWNPKETQKESTVHNNYTRPMNKKDGMAYSIITPHAKATNKETTLIENYKNGRNSALGTFNAGYELLGKTTITPDTFDNYNNYTNINVPNIIPSTALIGTLQNFHNNQSQYDNFTTNTNSQHNRFNGDLIKTQLKNNPYYNMG